MECRGYKTLGGLKLSTNKHPVECVIVEIVIKIITLMCVLDVKVIRLFFKL